MDETNKIRRIALGEGRIRPAKATAFIGGEIIQEQFPFQRTKVWIPRGDGFYSSPHPVLVVTQDVLTSVNEHVSETLEREVGGFLLGNRYFCSVENREYILVDNFWRARFTSGDSVSLDLTADAWADFNDQLTTKLRGKLLVGWYHSHPKMGVFLSNDDLRIHQSRFADPWMVALVIEPAKNMGGFFGWRGGKIHPHQPIAFFEYFGHRSNQSVVGWRNYFSDGGSDAPAVLTQTVNPKSGWKARRLARIWVTAPVCLLMLLIVVLLAMDSGGNRIGRTVESLYLGLRLSEELPPPPPPPLMTPVIEPRQPAAQTFPVVEEERAGNSLKPGTGGKKSRSANQSEREKKGRSSDPIPKESEEQPASPKEKNFPVKVPHVQEEVPPRPPLLRHRQQRNPIKPR